MAATAAQLFSYCLYKQNGDGWNLIGADPAGAYKTCTIAQCSREGYLLTRSYSITLTVSGAFTDGTGFAVQVEDYGNHVVLHFPPEVKSTAANQTITLSALPSDIRPSTVFAAPIFVCNASVESAGAIVIATSGVATIGVTYATAFTNSGNAGWTNGFTIDFKTDL